MTRSTSFQAKKDIMCTRIHIVSCVSRGVLQARYNAHTIDPSEWLKAIHIKLSVYSVVSFSFCHMHFNSILFFSSYLSFYVFSILHSIQANIDHTDGLYAGNVLKREYLKTDLNAICFSVHLVGERKLVERKIV